MNRRKALMGCTVALTVIAGCTSSDDLNSGNSNSDGNGGDGTSDLRGPTGREDRTYVDVPYRGYSNAASERIVEEAAEIEYSTLFRDIESYEGEAVYFEGDIIQALEEEDVFTFLVSLDNYGEELLYGSWMGDRYLKDDHIELWAEVIGTETYQMASGAENTVPALTIAAIRIIE